MYNVQREVVRTYSCFRWRITGTIQPEPPARVIAVPKSVLFNFYSEAAGEIFQEILYEEALNCEVTNIQHNGYQIAELPT